jgi:hypothetical protein
MEPTQADVGRDQSMLADAFINRGFLLMDNASTLPEMQARATPESHYDLYLRAGRSIGLYFRNTNHGVTLTPDRINWTFDGKADGAPFQNVRSVHLQTGGDWRDPISICTITFADGYKLVMVNADSYGAGADDARRHVYAAFVRDLHARLAAARSATTFTCGYQGARYPLIIACSVALGVICIVGPIAAMIYQRSIGPVMVLFAGVALYWPLTKAIQKNAPRKYDPHHPPEAMLE